MAYRKNQQNDSIQLPVPFRRVYPRTRSDPVLQNTVNRCSQRPPAAISRQPPTSASSLDRTLGHTQKDLFHFGLHKSQLTQLLYVLASVTSSLLYSHQHAKVAMSKLTEKPIKFLIDSEEELLQRRLSVESTIDATVENAIVQLEDIHQVISNMSKIHPIDTYSLAELVDLAKDLYSRTVFSIQRHFDLQVEGVRTLHERQLKALDQTRCLNPIRRFLKKSRLVFKHKLTAQIKSITSCRDHRLTRLAVARDKVLRHRLLVSLSEGSSEPDKD